MRRICAALLVVLLLSPDLPARDVHQWQNVEKLKRGTPVLILLQNGTEITGEVETVTDSAVEVAVPDSANYQVAWIQTIQRPTIRRITRTPGRPHLPNPGRWMLVGAVAGGAAGVASGAVSDARNGNQARWLIGGLAGSFGGAMFGLVAAAWVGIVQFPRAILRHKRVIFEAQTAPTVVNRVK
jgi:hypothetical protein